jgi:hypothetical protein
MEDSANWWNMREFCEELIKEGYIENVNWLENYLEPKIKERLLHLARMSYDKFLRHPSVFGLFGVDFMLDSDLNLYFIELVSGFSSGT